MANPFRLDNETAVITGGATGLGMGIARCFVEAGARVALVARREELLRAACAELGPAATYEVADVTDFPAAPGLIARIEGRIGPVSILVNNAGNILKKFAIDVSVDEFDNILRTHVLASHNLSRAVLPGMIQRKHGNIILIASMTSLMGVPQVIAYSAAKSAFVGMTRTLSAEVAQHGVRVNAVAPGWIDTPMLRKAMDGDEPRKNKVLSRTQMGRFGDPEDIGNAVVYLCSPAAKFVTGVVLPVDGGASIGF